MDKVRLSMVCMRSPVGDLRGNTDAVLRYLAEAAGDGADIACFPESCLTGYSMPRALNHRIPEDSPYVQEVVDATASSGICACFGFLDGGNHIAQAVAEDGKLLGIYRKTHLGFREKPCIVPGDEIPVFRTRKAVVGVQLCLESHFPEITGTLACKGADIVLMPHASGLNPERRKSTWNKVMPARAYDNTVFVAACNQAGDNGNDVAFTGGSCIYDPRGDLVTERYAGEGILTADLDGSEQERLRDEGNTDMRSLYFLNRRRPEIYFR